MNQCEVYHSPNISINACRPTPKDRHQIISPWPIFFIEKVLSSSESVPIENFLGKMYLGKINISKKADGQIINSYNWTLLAVKVAGITLFYAFCWSSPSPPVTAKETPTQTNILRAKIKTGA